MKVSYRRDLDHNYMILENDGVTGNEYTVRMMEHNEIPKLLKFQVRKVDGKTCLYYEITSKQPISRIYAGRSMKSRDILRLLEELRDGLKQAHQYLLDSENILLGPDYLYMDVDTGQLLLCYVPETGTAEKGSFVELAEFILKRLDHGDRAAVELGYDLYGQASRDNFSLQDTLKNLLERQSDGRNGMPERTVQEKENVGAGRQRENVDADDLFQEDILDKSFGKEAGMEQGKGNNAEVGKREGKKQKKNKSGNRKKSRGKHSRRNGRDKEKRRRILIWSGIITAAMVVFILIVILGKLDLTQTGGLGFLMIAVLWIGYSFVSGRKEKKKKCWMEDGDEDDEDAFIEALMSEIYDRDGEEVFPSEKNETGRHTVWEAQDRKEKEPEEYTGETRCLTASEYVRPLRLISMEPERYRDAVMEGMSALVGKRRDRVDICLESDSVSRIHARLERSGQEYYITDMNSTNGTFVNGDRLRPNEKRQFYAGDRIDFATMHYKVKKEEL